MSLKLHTYTHPSPFPLESGESLPTLTIAYHSSVEPNAMAEAIAEGRRVIWVCHALTANSDPSEWWHELVGSNKFFDTDNDIIVCANIIGSCYGTTGPINWGGKPLDFPNYSVRDIISAHNTLRRALGIEKINLLIGGSVGGYQSLEWAATEPECIENLVLIACNDRITPWQTAFNESQRMAIEADQTFAAQESLEFGGQAGLKAARTVALISYRSYEGYNLTQAEADENVYRAERASSYHQYQGKKLADRFNAYSYYCITRMLDTHNLGRGRGGVEKVLRGFPMRTLIIAIDSDILFPAPELQKMAKLIPSAQYVEVKSAFGHDGFLIEFDALRGAIDKFLSEK